MGRGKGKSRRGCERQATISEQGMVCSIGDVEQGVFRTCIATVLVEASTLSSGASSTRTSARVRSTCSKESMGWIEHSTT
eukprot:2944164-Rhodomonas_salina.1